MVHQSIIIMNYTRLCPFNEHLKPCYGKYMLLRQSNMRAFYLLQAIQNLFLLLFIYIYFEETTIQRYMAVIYIQRCLFSKKLHGSIYFETWHFGFFPVCFVFLRQWIPIYLRLLYCLSLIIFKFIWQDHVPVSEIYIFSVTHLKIVTAA